MYLASRFKARSGTCLPAHFANRARAIKKLRGFHGISLSRDKFMILRTAALNAWLPFVSLSAFHSSLIQTIISPRSRRNAFTIFLLLNSSVFARREFLIAVAARIAMIRTMDQDLRKALVSCILRNILEIPAT